MVQQASSNKRQPLAATATSRQVRLEFRAGDGAYLNAMSEFPLRSPNAHVSGMVHFGRMLDKIRANARGELPPDYHQNLGKGFDATCVKFLRIDYAALAERVQQGGSDESVLEWCYAHGHRPTADELDVWNEYMRKRGWRDELAAILIRRKDEAGLSDREDIATFFDFIDVDEGRALPH